MTKLAVVLILALVAWPATAEPKQREAQPPPPVLTVSQLGPDWSFYASSGVPAHPSALASGSGWQFTIPSFVSNVPCYDRPKKCSRVGYLTTTYQKPLLIGGSVSMTINLVSSSQNPTFGYQTESSNTCPTPAGVRLYIERAGDQKLATQPYHRWWSYPATITLQPGQHTITVAIDPALWSSVFGEFGTSSAAAADGFQQALGNVGKVGMTFGGGCFLGHGVYETDGGTTQVQMISYTVN